MSLFKKPDEHAGSGIDKPEPKSIVEKLADKMKTVTKPAAPADAPPAKGPAAP